MYLIGIDIGTGSTKAVAVETSGKVLHTAQASYPTLTPAPTYVEQSPELIWQAFIKCVSRITATLTEKPLAIGLSSAMHSLIPVDKDGEPLMNMITWADNRSAATAQRIRQSPQAKTIYEQTGTPLHAMSPLMKIIWLKEHEPDLFARVHKFISIKEYLWYKLFRTYEIDHAIASATGLFDIQKLEWHDEALRLCGITPGHLSSPVPTDYLRTSIAYDVAKLLNLPAETPFVIGASDGCLANLGTFATQPGVAALTIGTSGAIRVASTSPVFNFEAMTFNYRLDEKTFICGGPINNGGIALKWYAESFLNRSLASREDYHDLLKPIGEVQAGSDGLIFLPYILGERAPIWNSASCGVFFGITAQHKQKHFTRAVLEGISLALFQIGSALENEGLSIHQINVSGGFVKSPGWLQLLTDIFGKKVCLVNADDASAMGASFMAMKKLGIIQEYTELDDGDSVIFYPKENDHRFYRDEVFPRYRQLYKVLMVEMAILHESKNNYLTIAN